MSVRQQIVHATPAWMILVVGTLNISIFGVTLELPGAQAVSAFGLAAGLFFAVPLFTLILSPLIFEEPMPQPQRPSLLILVATFAVSFSAYLSVVGRVDLFASYECKASSHRSSNFPLTVCGMAGLSSTRGATDEQAPAENGNLSHEAQPFSVGA